MNTILKDYFTYPVDSTETLQRFNYGRSALYIEPVSSEVTTVELIGYTTNIQLFIENCFIGFITDQLQNVTPNRVLSIEFKRTNMDAWTLIETANVISILNGWSPTPEIKQFIPKV